MKARSKEPLAQAMVSMATENPTHLFISYAIEDYILAEWLARKLVAEGYAVWFDRLKLLGGEPWPQDIDVAIKERTFRMIGLLSASSLKKPNPSKERTLALNIARSRGIADFLIPLKVDFAELDWLTADLTYIPFNESWAGGLRQLLKKLQSLNAPKVLNERRSLAADSFDAGYGLILDTPEPIISNALLVTRLPKYLSVYSARESAGQNIQNVTDTRWAAYQVSGMEVVAFGPPPREAGFRKWKKTNSFVWRETDKYQGVYTSNIVRDLIERTLRARLLSAGCQIHPKRSRTYYLKQAFTDDGKLHFVGRSGKKTWCKIEGRTRVIRTGKPVEIVHHLFAFEILRWHLSSEAVAIQIRPTLVFTDSAGNLITDEKVGPLRRRLTKSWWNDKWLNRLLASAEIVTKATVPAGDPLQLADHLLRLEAEKSLNESALGGETSDAEEEDLPELVIQGDDETDHEIEPA